MRTILALLTICLAHAAAGVQVHEVDAATGAETWKTEAHGVALSLTQILPDQVRAFYVNRGFPLATAEHFASACVYMAVLRNDTAPGVVHFVLQDWRVRSGDQTQAPKSVAGWMAFWEAFELSQSARIAFRWAQFPPEQEYQPGGDWNQGMLSTGLAPGARFDLTAHWDVAGAPYQATLHEVTCAK